MEYQDWGWIFDCCLDSAWIPAFRAGVMAARFAFSRFMHRPAGGAGQRQNACDFLEMIASTRKTWQHGKQIDACLFATIRRHPQQPTGAPMHALPLSALASLPAPSPG